jgi:hypothetical protein
MDCRIADRWDVQQTVLVESLGLDSELDEFYSHTSFIFLS